MTCAVRPLRSAVVERWEIWPAAGEEREQSEYLDIPTIVSSLWPAPISVSGGAGTGATDVASHSHGTLQRWHIDVPRFSLDRPADRRIARRRHRGWMQRQPNGGSNGDDRRRDRNDPTVH